MQLQRQVTNYALARLDVDCCVLWSEEQPQISLDDMVGFMPN